MQLEYKNALTAETLSTSIHCQDPYSTPLELFCAAKPRENRFGGEKLNYMSDKKPEHILSQFLKS